ncbi:unnamed protein product [Clonostachys solani]|uniref:Uncharacterized protein n=1 Tax=Clonostachys solani TaxID=160281 RepID=A0A9N9ZHZ6_9HYPO|nr:unnamed protein product [Clonostachys solani]
METKRREYWYTIYLTLFILLHSRSMTTRRDKEYASSINLSVHVILSAFLSFVNVLELIIDQSTLCNPDGITQHNVGSKTLLAQFHMGLKGSLPFKLALEGNLHAEQYSGVFTPSEIGFIRWSAIEAATRKPVWGRIRASGDWANDEYWISQLFDDVWCPGPMD